MWNIRKPPADLPKKRAADLRPGDVFLLDDNDDSDRGTVYEIALRADLVIVRYWWSSRPAAEPPPETNAMRFLPDETVIVVRSADR